MAKLETFQNLSFSLKHLNRKNFGSYGGGRATYDELKALRISNLVCNLVQFSVQLKALIYECARRVKHLFGPFGPRTTELEPFEKILYFFWQRPFKQAYRQVLHSF